MKVYISGKITGTTDYIERFAKAEKHLKSAGHEVVNPAVENAKLPEGTTYDGFMQNSLRLLDTCDAIYMLPDWRDSNGAMIEHLQAMMQGKHIWHGRVDDGKEKI